MFAMLKIFCNFAVGNILQYTNKMVSKKTKQQPGMYFLQRTSKIKKNNT